MNSEIELKTSLRSCLPNNMIRRGVTEQEEEDAAARNRSFTQSQSGRTDSRDKAPGTSGLVSAHGILLIPLVTRNKTSRSWHKLSARMKGLVYP